MQIDNLDDGSDDLQLKLMELEEQRRQFDIKAKQTNLKLENAKEQMKNTLDFNKQKLEQDRLFNERKLGQDKLLKEKQINVQKLAKKSK